MSSEKKIDQPEMKELYTNFLEYKLLPYQEGQGQAPMQTGEIENIAFLTLNRNVDKLLLKIDRSADESNRKFNEQRNWIKTMREEMIKDADYAKSKFECCSSTGCIGYILSICVADTSLLLYTLLCLCRTYCMLLLYMTDQWAVYLYR